MTQASPSVADPADPADPAEATTRPAIPLNYSNETSGDVLVRRGNGLAAYLGGWRQVGFAMGLGMVLGGLGFAINPRVEPAAFWMFCGGAVIGLCIRIPRWKE